MDIFDIITLEPANSTIDITIDSEFISLLIFGISFIIIFLMSAYHRRLIAICTLNYIAALFKYEKITYKDFAYLTAKVLYYRHKATSISREKPPIKSSKGKHYLWIGLIDTLNEVRYGKTVPSKQSFNKLYKTALEWLRHS